VFFNDWLSRRRLYTPQRVAVVDDSDGRRYRYEDLQTRAIRIAQRLHQDFGVSPRDRVACVAGNRIEYLDLYFACGKLGAILVPLNFRLPRAGLDELLEDCRPRVLVYESPFATIAGDAARDGLVGHAVAMDDDDGTGQGDSLEAWVSAEMQAEPPLETFQAESSDIAMILYTSGTTGRAKGAMIPYRQIHWNALNTIIGLQLTQDDAAFLNMPLYHTGGWHVLFTPLMLLGGRVVLQRGFDAPRCNQLVGPEKMTILFGVPTTLRMMWQADNFSAADFSHVRFAIFGGESCPMPVIEAFGARGVAMRQGYGLTEAGPNCFSLPAEDAVEKQGSIGLPNFHVAARLVTDDGREAGIGEVGELWMKGPHVFAGYWNQPGETAQTLRDRWVATGDLMTRDADGYYTVVGRKKDMYVSGGENVYPAHVERVLQGHRAIASAAVVGAPDPRWGETGCAFITFHPGRSISDEGLTAWCKRHLATFQCPTRFVVMHELPVGPSGKIDKLTLARQARGES
jgi:fatty-acyl-CoA synthase